MAVCGILLCASLLVFSVGSVTKSQAADTKSTYQNASTTPAVAGEIMMAPFLYSDNSVGVLVWSTVSGKSTRYVIENGTATKKTSIPDSPLN